MILPFKNNNNNIFYEKIGAHGLENIAKSGGLATGIDVLHCKKYWQNAKYILDVGSGYGRVIDCLLRNGYSESIVSIERCESLHRALHDKYLTNKKIRILKIDLHNILLSLSDLNSKKFDVILWMWSGIADFPPSEQSEVVCQLAKILKPNGKLIIDTMPEKVTPMMSTKMTSQRFAITLDNVTIQTYEPNESEIMTYATMAGLSKIVKTKCVTEIGRERCLYILRF